jgi:AcrR family transcriptional regulator
VIASTVEILAAEGYDQLTFEAVAERSGVSRPSIYRRWGDKAALVAETIAALRWNGPLPDEGTLRADLLALAATWSGTDATQDAILRGLLPAMTRSAALRDLVDRGLGRPRSAAFQALVGREALRRNVEVGQAVALAGSIFPAMAFYRLGVQGEAVTAEYVEHVIDGVLLPAIEYAFALAPRASAAATSPIPTPPTPRTEPR